nr:reverse transcriptase domain-containing protein [Tanacetum cinerariifolium]
MVPATTSLTDFNGETIWPLGQLRLLEIAIGRTVSAKGQTKLYSLLKKNLDIFPWQPSDMTRVPRSVAEHRINIQKGYPPVRQKKRGQAPERARAIQVEKLTEKLNLFAATPLSVSWTLTKAITKYRWQNQMKRKRLSTPATECIAIPKCHLVSRTLAPHTKTEMLRDIDETFRTFRRITMKLNPKKCTFGAVEGMFLGYMISPEGIKSCPDKTEALLRIPSPRIIKESAISVVLMIERGTVQKLVYFVSGALQVPKLNYTPMEKLVLALVFATKRVITKIERHAGRTQYYVSAKDIRKRKDPSGLLYKEAGRNSTRYISG